VFSASNRGDGHAPSGSVSKADPSAVPTVCDGSGVSVSGQDEEHPAIPATTPDTTVPRNVRRNVEGINYDVWRIYKNNQWSLSVREIPHCVLHGVHRAPHNKAKSWWEMYILISRELTPYLFPGIVI
jgi:hypothetical protein